MMRTRTRMNTSDSRLSLGPFVSLIFSDFELQVDGASKLTKSPLRPPCSSSPRRPEPGRGSVEMSLTKPFEVKEREKGER